MHVLRHDSSAAATMPLRYFHPAVLLPALAACVPYLSALRGGFVFDDHALVRDSPGGNPLLGGLWGDLPAAGYYRPLVQASFALDRWVYGDQAAGFHLTNLLLHMLLVVLCWHLLHRLSGRLDVPTLAATLFAVHPVHVEAVAWISGRGDLLAPALGAAGWLVLIHGGWLPAVPVFTGRRRRLWLLLAGMLWLAALLTKESAVALLLMAVWSAPLIAAGRRAPDQPPATSLLPALTTAALSLGAALALRLAVLGSWRGPLAADPLQNPAAGLGLADRAATAGSGLLTSLRLLHWPWPLRADYGVPVTSATPWMSLDGILALLALSAALTLLLLGLRLLVRGPAGRTVLLGAGLLVCAWLPVSSLGPLPGSLLAERYLVLPSLGLCLMAAAVPLLAGRWRPMATGALAALILLWGGLSASRTPAWQSDASLFAADVALPVSSYKSSYFYGLLSYIDGDDNRAAAAFDTCILRAPSFSPCHEGRGRLAMRQGDSQQAVAAAREAIAQEPPHPGVRARYRVLLAEALWSGGNPAAAESILITAMKMDPASATAARRLGDLRMTGGRAGEALAAYRMAVSLDAEEPVARFNMAMALLDSGGNDEARQLLLDLATHPQAPAATFYHLALAASDEGRAGEARDYLQRFIAGGEDPERLQDARRRLEQLNKRITPLERRPEQK